MNILVQLMVRYHNSSHCMLRNIDCGSAIYLFKIKIIHEACIFSSRWPRPGRLSIEPLVSFFRGKWCTCFQCSPSNSFYQITCRKSATFLHALYQNYLQCFSAYYVKSKISSQDWTEQGLTFHLTHFRSFCRRWGDCGISQDCSRSQSPQCARCLVVCARPLFISGVYVYYLKGIVYVLDARLGL